MGITHTEVVVKATQRWRKTHTEVVEKTTTEVERDFFFSVAVYFEKPWKYIFNVILASKHALTRVLRGSSIFWVKVI